jgi:hypothetical protein
LEGRTVGHPLGLRSTALLGAVLLASLVAPGESSARPCRRGRFLVQRNALMEDGAGGLETVALDPSRIAISVGCRGVKPLLTPTREGTKVSATWARCTDLLDRTGKPARAKLKAFIASPTCDTLTGTLVVRRATPRRRSFTAALSRCGDGYLDEGNGENCGDEGATCAPGGTCTDECKCDPPSATTTTTTSTGSSTSTTIPGQFTCTEILGFSQTLQWMDTTEFEQHIDDARWQARLRAGGHIDVWADPNADAWDPPVQATCTDTGATMFLCSPCARGSDAPDRVLVTITLQEYLSDVQVWAQKIRAAIATIRLKHPSVAQIVLQPVVGGPMHTVCPVPGVPLGVRASYNHPYIDQAIAIVVGDSPDIVAGFSPEVHSCADYADDLGHLDPAARGPIGLDIGQYYGP